MYLLGAITWGSTVALAAFAGIAKDAHVRGTLPTLAEVLGCLGMGLVHGATWPLSLPLTLILFGWSWLRRK
jgi:hypothetical protein